MANMISRTLLLISAAAYFGATLAELVTVVAPFQTNAPAVSAQILGVDAQGHTTYAVQQEELDIELDGTHTRAVMTATLVEGSDYISYTLNHQSGSENLHLGVHCNVSGDNLICGDTKPLTLTSVGYLTLDVGTGAPKETGAPGTNGAIGAGQKTAASVLNVAVALILAAAANQLF